MEGLLWLFEFGVLELNLELLMLEFLKLFDFYLFLLRLDLFDLLLLRLNFLDLFLLRLEFLDLFFLWLDLFDLLLELFGFFLFGNGSGCPLCLEYLAGGLRGLDNLLAGFLMICLSNSLISSFPCSLISIFSLCSIFSASPSARTSQAFSFCSNFLRLSSFSRLGFL